MYYLDYHNLDIEIERIKGNYRVRVIYASDSDPATTTFNTPISEEALNGFLGSLNGARRGLASQDTAQLALAESFQTQKATEFGKQLFNKVFRGDTLVALHDCWLEAQRQKKGLRVRLHFRDAPDLVDLPWEYLYDPDPDHRRFFALQNDMSLVRYLDLGDPIRSLTIAPSTPLSILVMISKPKLDSLPILDSETEWNRLSTTLKPLVTAGKIILDRVPTPTQEGLLEQLGKKPYHIFHFIGHGGFNSVTRDGELLFEPSDTQASVDPVSASDIATYLHNNGSVHLVVLNSCDGATTDHVDAYSGTAQRLMAVNIPAVVAMQFAITDSAGKAFAGAFYQALADFAPVDAAVTAGREVIKAANNQVEWATPVLYLRSPDGRIFSSSQEAIPKGGVSTGTQESGVELAMTLPHHILGGGKSTLRYGIGQILLVLVLFLASGLAIGIFMTRPSMNKGSPTPIATQTTMQLITPIPASISIPPSPAAIATTVPSSEITPDVASPTSDSFAAPSLCRVFVDRLNLRSYPDPDDDSNIMMRLSEGTDLIPLGRTPNNYAKGLWLRVRIKNSLLVGWMKPASASCDIDLISHKCVTCNTDNYDSLPTIVVGTTPTFIPTAQPTGTGVPTP